MKVVSIGLFLLLGASAQAEKSFLRNSVDRLFGRQLQDCGAKFVEYNGCIQAVPSCGAECRVQACGDYDSSCCPTCANDGQEIENCCGGSNPAPTPDESNPPPPPPPTTNSGGDCGAQQLEYNECIQAALSCGPECRVQECGDYDASCCSTCSTDGAALEECCSGGSNPAPTPDESNPPPPPPPTTNSGGNCDAHLFEYNECVQAAPSCGSECIAQDCAGYDSSCCSTCANDGQAVENCCGGSPPPPETTAPPPPETTAPPPPETTAPPPPETTTKEAVTTTTPEPTGDCNFEFIGWAACADGGGLACNVCDISFPFPNLDKGQECQEWADFVDENLGCCNDGGSNCDDLFEELRQCKECGGAGTTTESPPETTTQEVVTTTESPPETTTDAPPPKTTTQEAATTESPPVSTPTEPAPTFIPPPPTSNGETCPDVGCCEHDCCATATRWDTTIKRCVADPSSSGWDGTYPPDYDLECADRVCCESDCCSPGTVYDETIKCCVPASAPTTPAETDPPTMTPPAPTETPPAPTMTPPAPTPSGGTSDCPDGTGCDICPNGTIADDNKVVTIINPIDQNPSSDNCGEWFAKICLADGGMCSNFQSMLASCCA